MAVSPREGRRWRAGGVACPLAGGFSPRRAREAASSARRRPGVGGRRRGLVSAERPAGERKASL